MPVRETELDDVEALIDACQTGLALIEPETAADVFNEKLDQLIAGRLDPDERPAFEAARIAGGLGLKAARSGHLGYAADALAKAREIIRTRLRDPDTRLLARALLHAQQAYLWHRRNHPARAERSLGAAFRIDLILERRGFEILAAHRLQLGHNLVRLYAHTGRTEDAFILGIQLLHAIERPGDPPHGALPRSWRSGWSDTPPVIERSLSRRLHHRIARELIALALALAPAAAAQSVHQALAKATGPSQARCWLAYCHARAAATDRNRAAIAILKYGPAPSVPLWRDAVIHVIGDLDARLAA